MPISRWFALIAALGGLLAVAGGAFGAHALRTRIDAEALAIYQTAVQYQMWHSLALAWVASWLERAPEDTRLRGAGCAFVAGIVLFCGSLYAVAVSGLRGLGMITPFGGLAFLVGWACLAWASLRERSRG